MIVPLLTLILPALTHGHGAMTFPKPRNSIDGDLTPWQDWSYPCDANHHGKNCQITFCENGKNCQGSCPISSHKGKKNSLNASNGQACYWFSNGCTIGCDKCDGTSNHVGHGNQQFLYNGKSLAQMEQQNITISNPFTPEHGSMKLNPNTTTTLDIKSNCEHPTTNATICDSRLRTCNTQAACGSKDDFYYYSPWRAPGSAPLIDACGSAGGRHPGQGTGGAGAQFENTSVAKEGDLGSQLPMGPSRASWVAGGHYEVGWTVMANHGGGYAYRLAPADQPMTEENFIKLPLDFVGNSVLRWDGNVSTQLEFNSAAKGWETSVGTVPRGSTWRKNPIPSGLWEREGASFEPVCEESKECIDVFTTSNQGGDKQGLCRCSGYSNGGPLLPNVEIVDLIKIPEKLAPGKYVLQWRWDCEESDQIWASCSDVTVVESL